MASISFRPEIGAIGAFEVIARAKLLVHEEHPAKFAELTREFLHQLG